MQRNRLALILFTASACYAQWIPTTVQKYTVANITSSATVIDNRSQFIATADFHTCYVTGTGSWSAQLQYADAASTGPWTNFPEGSSYVTNSSTPPTCQATGYHAFLRFIVTGTASITYAGSKGYYPGGNGNGGGGGAPTNATYILQTANGSLPSSQALGSLSTGVLKNTNVTGVLSIATGSDLPTGIPVASIDSGTITSAQFNRLSGVTSNIQTQIDSKGTVFGTHTSGDCLEWDSSGRIVTAASAAPCGAGGGNPAGSTTELQYRLNGTTFGADSTVLYVPQVATPSAPAVTNIGSAGSTHYSYYVVAHNGIGTTPHSTATVTTTGNATLDGSNYNRITTVVATGVLYYDVFRSASSGTPSSTGNISLGVTPGAVVNDTGIVADPTIVAPVTNTTIGIQANGFTNGLSQMIFGSGFGPGFFSNQGQIGLFGQYIAQSALVPGFVMQSTGSNFGLFGNDSSTSWYLGSGPASNTNSGATKTIRWDDSGAVGLGTFTGVLYGTAGVVSVVTGGSGAYCVHVDGTSAACGGGGGSGTVTNTGTLTNNQLVVGNAGVDVKVGNLAGDVSTSGGLTTTLATVNSNVGACGDATHTCQVTLNGKGLATAASQVAITAGTGTVTNTGTLTADLPMFGNGTVDSKVGTKEGNTNKAQMFAGSAPTASDCAQFDGSGNITTAGAPCGSGSTNATQFQSRAFAATAPADTNTICWDAGGTTWKPCTAGGGGGASTPSALGCSVTYSSTSRITIFSDATATTPCVIALGNTTYRFTSVITVDLSAGAGTGTAYVYMTAAGILVGHNLTNADVSCSGCTKVPSITSFPTNAATRLYTWTATADTWDAAGGTDYRAIIGSNQLTKVSTGISGDGDATPLSVDAAVVTTFQSAPANSSVACTVGQIAMDSSFAYFCTAANTWRRVATSSF